MSGQIEPLVLGIVSMDDAQISFARTYLQQNVKNPLIFEACKIESYNDDIDDFINGLRTRYHPQHVIFLSVHRMTELMLLNKMHSTLSYKDYILMVLPTYSKLLYQNLHKKIYQNINENIFPEAWMKIGLSPEYGNWRLRYKDEKFEVKFKLKRKVQIECASESCCLPRYHEIPLIRIFLPREKELLKRISEFGYTLIFSCKEEKSSMNIFVFQKSGKPIRR